MIDRRQQLRELYGFDFPEHFFRFWDFARRLRPLEPLKALDELSLQLVGPFEVLAGRFDRRSPRLSLLLHWRYYFDPPEFFTVLAGNIDGLHWGCYLDDSAAASNCVASYYASDAFDLSVDGDDLFEAARLHLEYSYRDCEEYSEYDLDAKREYEEEMQQLDAWRERITAFATKSRSEVGAAYVDRFAGRSRRRPTARTQEGMGIVVRPEQYRPLSLKDAKLWPYLSETDNPLDVVAEARQALREGFPGTALKLGKDLWAIGGEQHTEYAYELLDAAYAAVGRERLREVLRVHRANRDLPSVDILENETE
ncbi:MAG TPA: ADP-ribosylation family protein [Gemmataceae bacterium]|nr:ADP-ribosylation family protein [Gemmataceae bacterium]